MVPKTLTMDKAGVTNSYGIRSRDALRKKAQYAAQTGAVGYASEAQQSAHKTIKEKSKKKQTSDHYPDRPQSDGETGIAELQDAENRVARAMEQLGYGHEQLLELPTDLVCEVLERVSKGLQSAGTAANELAAELPKLPGKKEQ